MSAPEVVASVKGASKKFCRDSSRSARYAVADALRDLFMRRAPDATLRPDEFWALRDVSFDVRRGESVGVMGLNGAGKSTLLKLMLGSMRLTEGTIVTHGRLAALSEHGLGFEPLLTGRENVYMTAAMLEIERPKVDATFGEIVAFAGLEAFIDSPVRVYSTGMRARLGFSIAMHLEPDILLVDEVLAVGDVGFQRQCIRHAQRYLKGGGSLVLVSHNPHLVQFVCDRCLILDKGTLVSDGDVVQAVARYLQATRTASGDALALDAALGSATPQVQTPIETHGVIIDDFNVRPIDSESLRTGAPARVSIRYRSNQRFEIRWGFCLLSANLDTTITCEGPPGHFSISAGAGEVAGTILRLPLVDGHYALRVAIMDAQTELPLALGGFNTPPRYFTVSAPTSVRNNYRMFTGDLVALEEVAWERLDSSVGRDLQA
jgi:lipopolysaccharide transport system ATP-binding protein